MISSIKTKRYMAVAILVCLMAVAYSCTKNSEDKLMGGGVGSNTPCDTVDMKYAEDVVPILQANCYSCHGNGNTAGSGGVLLEGFNNIKVYASNGYLVGNVTHNPNPMYTPMPYGEAELPICEINTIVDWVNNGALNN